MCTLDCKMKREVPPSAVSELVTFPSLPCIHIGKDIIPKSVFAHISKDGNWGWRTRDSVLEVFSTCTRECFSSWRFGAVLKSTSPSISAIAELISSYVKFPCLLIGLNFEGEGGLLCMFNGKTSKVVKVIELPYKITSIEVVSGEGGASIETHPQSPIMHLMFGIAAVGTENGHVLFVDLCLDEENYSDEVTPNKVSLVTKISNNIASKRDAAVSHNHHLCFSLRENSLNNEVFEYHNPDNTVSGFNAEDIIISSMKYLRSLVALAIGFNFGGIELWNLQNLSLIQTFPVHCSELSVVQFAFQEPENDPKNFCYLWAVVGCYQGENYRPDDVSVATLYSLTYSQKNWINGYGYFYQGLLGCSKRFEYPFSLDPYFPTGQSSPSFCSRLISCQVAPQTDILRFDNEDSLQNEDWNNSEDLSLCVMAWEILPSASAPSCYLAIFDLNQWYQAQMPSSLRCDSDELPSFLGIFSLQEVTNKLNSELLLDVYVIPQSLSKFKCLTTAEEFFYPSSLSFKILCTSVSGIMQANYLGTQRQLLFEMNQAGPNCLVDPKELFSCCLISGLLNNIHSAGSGRQTVSALKREALLTLAFENNMLCFIHACMQKWRTGEFSQFGCSSKFVLDWAWKKVTEMKTSTDRLCQPLFNCSGENLDKSTLQTIHSYGSQLIHLTGIITSFKNLPGPKTEQGQRELTLKAEVVHSIALYIQILIRLYDCHLLPEHLEGDEYGEDEVAYPTSRLKRIYSCRRLEIQKLHSSVAATDVLLVDGLVAEIGTPLTKLWEAKGGSDVYPPPNFYAAVSMYLLDGVSVSQKHQLLYYLILDVGAIFSDHQAHLWEKLMKFPEACDLSPSFAKLTYAFWLLDHQDFEAAIMVLIDPIILAVDIAPWCHNRILKSFLYQGHQKKALNYLNVRKPPQSNAEEIKLHLSILLANGLTSEAFYFQRQHQSEDNYEDLLNHLFLSCQQTHSLYALLQMPLNNIESTVLANFFNNSLEPLSQEILVMFYLLRCRPLEAARLNEKLSTQIVEKNPRSQERSKIRSSLVTGFLNTLPEEQKRFAQEVCRINVAPIGCQEAIPQPLSASITCSSLKVLSYADVLSKVISKVNVVSQIVGGPVTPSPEKSGILSSSVSTPFLGPPGSYQSERKRRRLSNVVFATPVSKTPVKRSLDSPDFASPPKKSIFGESSFRITDSERRKSTRHLSGDLLSLLQTPPICRKSSKFQSTNVVESISTITPQSILKMRSSIRRTPSPPILDYNAQTPSLSSKENSNESSGDEVEFNVHGNGDKKAPSQDDTLLKQLRFQDPFPPCDSPFLKSDYLQTGLSPALSLSNSSVSSSSERAVRASPRRPLRDFDISGSSECSDVFLPARALLSSSLGNQSEFQNTKDVAGKFSSSENEKMEIDACEVKSAKVDIIKAPVKNDKFSHEDSKCSSLSSKKFNEHEASEQNHSIVNSSPYQRTRSKSKSVSPDKRNAVKTLRTLPVIFSPELVGIEHKGMETKANFTEVSKSKNSSQNALEAEQIKDDMNEKVEPLPIVPIDTQSTVAEEQNLKSQNLTKAVLKNSSRRKSMKATGKKELRPQFSFSEPNVSSDAEILETITSTPDTPVPSFVFSPPVTRAKLKQKKMDETLNSSYMSAAPESSFISRRKLLIDPLLDTSVVSIPERGISSSRVLASSTRRIGKKKTRSTVPSDSPMSQSIINLLSPLTVREGSPDKESQSLLASSRHSMILRKKKAKRKSLKVW